VTTAVLRPPVVLRQAITFFGLGMLSTVVSVAIYTGLREAVQAQAANALAMLATAAANTVANRRLTFGIRDGRHAFRDQLVGLAFVGLGLAMSATALLALAMTVHHPSRLDEVTSVFVASSLVGVMRFCVLWFLAARRNRRALPVES
jgi:putative flippase GtrA